MLAAKITRFLADSATANFEELALEAFAYQFERIGPLRRLGEKHDAVPGKVAHWSDVPMVPTLAFKTLDLAAAPAEETFRSSGTSGGPRSVHGHGFPDLYRATIDASFAPACLGAMNRPPMLSLIPTRSQAPDSSLSFMIDHVLAQHGAPESLTAFGNRGLDATKARSFLAARQREGRATLLLTTAFALATLLEALERLDLRFRLPAGSVVFETGGYKGRTREVSRVDLLARLSERLGIATSSVVREYGMTELTSQLYTQTLVGRDTDLFVPPHWVRCRILEPTTLVEQPPGQEGLIALFDLANLSSAVHLLTEDLGMAEDDGLRLTGRAAGAELRGCSLTVEELTEV
jgi:acyl-CoA synthetase (AMP-forming)/AMP-acid ligase II